MPCKSFLYAVPADFSLQVSQTAIDEETSAARGYHVHVPSQSIARYSRVRRTVLNVRYYTPETFRLTKIVVLNQNIKVTSTNQKK